MNKFFFSSFLTAAVVAVSFGDVPALARQDDETIAPSQIEEVQKKLEESDHARSSSRKKLALKRVLRSAHSLLEKNNAASNRFEVLGILFRAQQALIQIDDSISNRKALLETCSQLANAPNRYAAIRFDADLLLSQAELAKRGASQSERAQALKPLVERYQDTEVEAKVIRVAMLMALEFGDSDLVSHLRQVIAERFAGDQEMINFQRDKLAGQVFGAPFIGQFEQSDGTRWRFPMDALGTTTGLYFWSTKNGGLEDLQELAAAWKKVKPEDRVRYRFVSFNLDDLPDAGESILRSNGLEWPALKLTGGAEHPIYKTYSRRNPTIITVSPTGYAALFLSGGRRSRGYERNLQSMLARTWTQPRYTSQLQAMVSGEWLVVDPFGKFDPRNPPEMKVVSGEGTDNVSAVKPGSNLVPEDVIKNIQSCFVVPPLRYRASPDQLRAGFGKVDALCRQAIMKNATADNLWIVRNRRIAALLGLWQVSHQSKYFHEAVSEAKAAIEKSGPPGTDVLARYCLAKQALRSDTAEPAKVISSFIQQSGGKQSPGSASAAAAFLALDAGDRRLHENYRSMILKQQIDNPMLCSAISFFLNRYHRYWLYHPPFVAGWTYGRRQGHFLATGEPAEASRTLQFQLKTIEGKTLEIPRATAGKWTVIEFVSSAEGHRYLQRYGAFVEKRPVQDVQFFAAVFGEDAETISKKLKEKKQPDAFPTLLVPGGINNPIVNQAGMLAEDEMPNLVMLRPDGSIAVAVSGLTMRYQKENLVQNVIEWHDEQAVDLALSRGDLEEAKRLAFAFAPPEPPQSDESKQKNKPVPLSIPHRRSRAKVYMAMQDWEAALDDIQEVYLQVNSKAGWLSMRTAELVKTEKLRSMIQAQAGNE